MALSAKEAAALVGMTKQGIIHAIHKGTISAKKNEKNNQWEIEPVELFRVYPAVSREVSNVTPDVTPSQSEILRERVSMLERMVDDKDKIIQQLFDRLAAQQQVTLQLEDKQHQPWWRRWLR